MYYEAKVNAAARDFAIEQAIGFDEALACVKRAIGVDVAAGYHNIEVDPTGGVEVVGARVMLSKIKDATALDWSEGVLTIAGSALADGDVSLAVNVTLAALYLVKHLKGAATTKLQHEDAALVLSLHAFGGRPVRAAELIDGWADQLRRRVAFEVALSHELLAARLAALQQLGCVRSTDDGWVLADRVIFT